MRSKPGMAPRATIRRRRLRRWSSGIARRTGRRARRHRPRRRGRSWRVRSGAAGAVRGTRGSDRRASTRRHAARRSRAGRGSRRSTRACAAPTIHSAPSRAASKSSRNATAPGRGVSCTGFERRPAVVAPRDRGDEGLPSECREGSGHAARANAEQHQQPLAVGAEDEVAVPGVLDRPVGAARGEQRVGRRVLERSLGARGPRDAHAVAALGAALGDDEVPPVADAVEVRGFGELPADARPDAARLLERAAGLEVDARLQQPAVLA